MEMQINITPIKVESFLYLESKIPEEILNQVKKDVEYVFNNQKDFEKYNQKLAGNLKKEFEVHKTNQILEPILIALANECYKHLTETDEIDEDYIWAIPDVWVNYQQKYEHNPIHKHTGDLSFILWIKIPYDLEQELNLENAINSNNPSNSLFNFVYTDIWGRITAYPLKLDKSCEGKIVVFPSFLNHMVYPFHTSDEYRISVSGNLIRKKIEQQSMVEEKKGFEPLKSNQKKNLITY